MPRVRESVFGIMYSQVRQTFLSDWYTKLKLITSYTYDDVFVFCFTSIFETCQTRMSDVLKEGQ